MAIDEAIESQCHASVRTPRFPYFTVQLPANAGQVELRRFDEKLCYPTLHDWMGTNSLCFALTRLRWFLASRVRLRNGRRGAQCLRHVRHVMSCIKHLPTNLALSQTTTDARFPLKIACSRRRERRRQAQKSNAAFENAFLT